MLPLETIDRTIFELLRREAVRRGVLPDWRTTPGTGAAKRTAFEAAKAALLNGGITPVDVYGVGSDSQKDTKTKNRIVVVRGEIQNGVTSKYSEPQFTQDLNAPQLPNGQQPFVEEYASNPVNINYEIRAFADKTANERLIGEIILMALGIARKDLRGVDNLWQFSGDGFSIAFDGSARLTPLPDVIEYVYRYTVLEVKIIPCTLVRDNISPIVDIPLGLSVLGAGDNLPQPPPPPLPNPDINIVI